MLSSVSWYILVKLKQIEKLKSKHFENSELCIKWIMHLYSALCIVVHPKRLQSYGGGGGLSSTTTSVQHPLGWCYGATGQRHQCAHHTPATGGERESHRTNQVYALTTHQLQVERRESHRANQVYALTTHQLQVERRESHRANQGCAHHTPATGGEERES